LKAVFTLCRHRKWR